jgi:hypothetical protein
MTANASHNIFQIDTSFEGTAGSLLDIFERTSIDYYCMPLPGAIPVRHDLLRLRLMSGELAA